MKHADFERVYQEGHRHFSALLTVFFLRRSGLALNGKSAAAPRIGFTVPRALGGSVERNRIRRRMREAVRLQLARLSSPFDIVINPKKFALKTDFQDLLAEVGRAFDIIEQASPKRSAVTSEKPK